jgi:hypothetical protein
MADIAIIILGDILFRYNSGKRVDLVCPALKLFQSKVNKPLVSDFGELEDQHSLSQRWLRRNIVFDSGPKVPHEHSEHM